MRLIDADELADRLTKMWAYALQDNDLFGQGEMHALVGAIRAVNEAPTVNVIVKKALILRRKTDEKVQESFED